MTSLVKSAALTVAVVVGAAASAYAQPQNIAALPPGVPAPAPVAAGPSAPGSEISTARDPRDVWGMLAKNPATPAPFLGPAPHTYAINETGE